MKLSQSCCIGIFPNDLYVSPRLNRSKTWQTSCLGRLVVLTGYTISRLGRSSGHRGDWTYDAGFAGVTVAIRQQRRIPQKTLPGPCGVQRGRGIVL